LGSKQQQITEQTALKLRLKSSWHHNILPGCLLSVIGMHLFLHWIQNSLKPQHLPTFIFLKVSLFDLIEDIGTLGTDNKY
jgi:hypothetical protein